MQVEANLGATEINIQVPASPLHPHPHPPPSTLTLTLALTLTLTLTLPSRATHATEEAAAPGQPA